MYVLSFQNSYKQWVYWTGRTFSFFLKKAKLYKTHAGAEKALDRIRKTQKGKWDLKLDQPAIDSYYYILGES